MSATSAFPQWLQGVSTGQTRAIGSLRDRIDLGLVEEQDNAKSHLDAILASATLTDGGSLWMQPAGVQTTALSWWYTMMHWQFARGLLDGAAQRTIKGQTHISAIAHRMAEFFCQSAEDGTIHAIRNEATPGDAGPKLLQIQNLPSLPVNVETYAGVWAVIEAICLEAHTSVQRILGNVPERFAELAAPLNHEHTTNIRLYEHYEHRWLLATTAEIRVDIARDALEVARAQYTLCQKLYAPYLVGQTYRAALSRPVSLSELRMGFSPWILTAPAVAHAMANDQSAVTELAKFWNGVTNRSQARQLREEIDTAVRCGRVRLTPESYPTIPWPARYLVRYPISIGGRTFASGDYIVFYVNAASNGANVEVRRSGKARTIAELLGQE